MKEWRFGLPHYLGETLDEEERSALCTYSAISEAFYLADGFGTGTIDAVDRMCLHKALEKGDMTEASVCGFHALAREYIKNHTVDKDPEFIDVLHSAFDKIIRAGDIHGAAIAMRLICDLPNEWELPIRLKAIAKHALEHRWGELYDLLDGMCDDEEELERALSSYRDNLHKLANNESAVAGTA